MSSRFGFSKLLVTPQLGASTAVASNESAPAPAEQPAPEKFEGFMVPKDAMSDPNEIEKIDRIVWLRVEFLMSASGWKLRYTSKAKKSVFKSVDPKNRTELDDAIKLGHRLPRELRKTTRRFRRPEKKDGTHLSVKGNKRQLVIITLSDDANIRFNRDGSAISTSWEHACSFLEAGVVKDNGQVEQYKAVDANLSDALKNDRCKTAYFIIDPTIPSRVRGSGFIPAEACPLPDPSKKVTPKSFNIHLDLVGRRLKDTTQNQEDEYLIPIIIDPDVRHPGGYS